MNDAVISYGNLARRSSISPSHVVNKVSACFSAMSVTKSELGRSQRPNPFLAPFFFLLLLFWVLFQFVFRVGEKLLDLGGRWHRESHVPH